MAGTVNTQYVTRLSTYQNEGVNRASVLDLPMATQAEINIGLAQGGQTMNLLSWHTFSPSLNSDVPSSGVHRARARSQ